MSGSRVLTLHGEVDVAAVEALRAGWYLLAEQETPALIVVDASEVTFIDAAGLGLLVGVRNRQRSHGGTVELRNAPECVTALLRLAGLLEVFMCPEASTGTHGSRVVDLREAEIDGHRSARQAI
jgi:anti-anti-sigma factor